MESLHNYDSGDDHDRPSKKRDARTTHHKKRPAEDTDSENGQSPSCSSRTPPRRASLSSERHEKPRSAGHGDESHLAPSEESGTSSSSENTKRHRKAAKDEATPIKSERHDDTDRRHHSKEDKHRRSRSPSASSRDRDKHRRKSASSKSSRRKDRDSSRDQKHRKRSHRSRDSDGDRHGEKGGRARADRERSEDRTRRDRDHRRDHDASSRSSNHKSDRRDRDSSSRRRSHSSDRKQRRERSRSRGRDSHDKPSTSVSSSHYLQQQHQQPPPQRPPGYTKPPSLMVPNHLITRQERDAQKAEQLKKMGIEYGVATASSNGNSVNLAAAYAVQQAILLNNQAQLKKIPSLMSLGVTNPMATAGPVAGAPTAVTPSLATIAGPAPLGSLQSLTNFTAPSILASARYTEQMQQRKQLWSHKKTTPLGLTQSTATAAPSSSTAAPSASVAAPPPPLTTNKWEETRFSQDNDGKVASKFLRLMGMKDVPTKSDAAGATDRDAKSASGTDPLSKQNEMFHTMEHQYEVARQVTHTMRGMGLGFGSQPRPF